MYNLYYKTFLKCSFFSKKIVPIYFLLLTIFTYGQTYIIKYQSIPISKLKQEKDNPIIYYTLIHSNNKSVYFKSEQDKKEDSLKFILNNEIPKIEFRDFDQHTQFIQTSIFGEGYNVKENMIPLNWTITSEKKKIGKITCTIAKSKIENPWNKVDDIYACFDENIPIKDGPEQYYGLPGLIVEIITPNKKIEVTEIKTSKEITSLKLPENNYKTLECKEYDTILEDKMDGMRNEMKEKKGKQFPISM